MQVNVVFYFFFLVILVTLGSCKTTESNTFTTSSAFQKFCGCITPIEPIEKKENVALGSLPVGSLDEMGTTPYLEKLYQACHFGEADVSIGSRYVTGVNVVNWPLSRVLMSYFASVYVKIITGMKIHDATAGFICYKREVLEKINIDKIHFIGYAFQIEMKYRAFAKKFRIVEVPIIFTDRTKGESKMSNAIITEAVFGVISLRIRNLFNRL